MCRRVWLAFVLMVMLPFILIGGLVFALPVARAQAAPPPVAVASAAAPGASLDKGAGDDEATDSPRASYRSYIEACDRAHYGDAARYLDVPRGLEQRRAELARKLHDVLSERLWVDPDKLSGSSHGNKGDGLPIGTEELGKIRDDKDRVVTIRLVRREPKSADDETRWVFARSTVDNIDGLYATLKARWLRDRLAGPLLDRGWYALYYWQWVALPVLALLCLGVGRVLAWFAGFIALRILAKRRWTHELLHALRRPVTMAFALAIFWAVTPYLAFTLIAENTAQRILRSLGHLAFFWALLLLVNFAGAEIAKAPWARTRPSVGSLLSVGMKLGKFIVAALAAMAALSELGYPVTSIVAGLGLGGVALALAAQKTVENLFGSLSILADQPFVVGEIIRFDTVEGTVESIGLRSTRLRTIDRTLVVIPNGKLADMRIESLGPRDRIRFATKLLLARSTSPKQIRTIVADIKTMLQSHPRVCKEDTLVRVTGIGESSFDVDVIAFVDTRVFDDFAEIREQLILGVVEVVERAGATLALPTRTVVCTRNDEL
ncbi:MAG: mechanosensitive ion channel family protein [Polyangiaceae bacterium]|nr:mechanosensitive ion channel family protein [Polyangiaceae bacterium]